MIIIEGPVKETVNQLPRFFLHGFKGDLGKNSNLPGSVDGLIGVEVTGDEID